MDGTIVIRPRRFLLSVKWRRMIKTKSIYEAADSDDGYRVLVDRLWPRGLTRERADIDEWMREAGPSDALRKRFHADPSKWDEFRAAYFDELKSKGTLLDKLIVRSREARVTLLFSSHDKGRNQAVILKEYLDDATRRRSRAT